MIFLFLNYIFPILEKREEGNIININKIEEKENF